MKFQFHKRMYFIITLKFFAKSNEKIFIPSWKKFQTQSCWNLELNEESKRTSSIKCEKFEKSN